MRRQRNLLLSGSSALKIERDGLGQPQRMQSLRRFVVSSILAPR